MTAMDSFDNLVTKTFISQGFGLVVKAPENWVEESDSDVFSIRDPLTGITLSASGYSVSGLSLQQFAEFRLGALAKTMPTLQETRMEKIYGEFGEGVEAEYAGKFPGNDFSSIYRFACIVKPDVAVSVSIAGEKAIMEAQRDFCDWLLSKKIDIYRIERHTSS